MNFGAGESGAREPKMVVKPCLPSQREIDEHMLAHTPFRSWCPHGVKGQAAAHAPKRKDQETHEGEIPIVSMGYMFMNERESVDQEASDERGMPILVMSDHATHMTFSTAVPKKGVHAYSVVRCCNDISLLGYSKIILK